MYKKIKLLSVIIFGMGYSGFSQINQSEITYAINYSAKQDFKKEFKTCKIIYAVKNGDRNALSNFIHKIGRASCRERV